MKSAEKKRRARKFNVCKKICQLNRVATLFSIQYQEQTFQRQYLSDFYSAKIAAALNDAWNESEKYYSEINNIHPAVNLKYFDIFAKKYKIIKIDINVYTQSTGEMIQRKLQNINKQIEFKLNEINSINQKIENFHNPCFVSELFDGFVDNLNSLLKIQKQRFHAQKNSFYSSFNAKISLLTNESDMRIQKIRTEYEIESGLIKSTFFGNFENNDLYHRFYIDFLTPFRKRFKHYQNILTGIVNKFHETINSTKKSLYNAKEQIFREVDIIRNLQQKIDLEKKEVMQKINQNIIHTYLDNINYNEIIFISIESIKQELQIKINDYHKERETLKSTLFEIQQEFKNNYQHLALNSKERLSDFDAIFSEIKKTQSVEINNCNIKYKQIEESATDRIKQIEKEISIFTENKDQNEQALRNQLAIIKLKNLNTIDQISKEFAHEKEFLILDFQERKNKIQDKTQKLTCDIKNLKNEKENILTRFQSFIDKIDNDEKREIADLMNKYNFLISELQTDLSNKMNELIQKSNDEIEKVQIECKKKKNDKIKQNNFLYNQEILQFQFNFESSNKCYLKETEKKYSKSFEKYQNELNSISPPSSNTSLARIITDVSGFEKKLNDLIEIIECERRKLNEAFNSRITREEERHVNRINEQKEMLEIIYKIEKVRKEKEAKLNELAKYQHNSFNENQCEFERKRELIELRFLNQKELIMNQIESVQNELAEKKEFLIKSISELKKSHEIQLKPLQAKYNLILRKQRASLMHSPNSSAISFEELVLKKMRQHKEKMKKLRETMHEVQKVQQISENDFEHQLYINQQKNKKKFESNEIRLKDELIVLNRKRDDLKTSLKNINGRYNGIEKSSSSLVSCGISNEEKITKLKIKLNKVNQQLSSVLAEYKKYKDIFLDAQENGISSLGASQAMAVLQLNSPRSVSPKYNVS